MTRYPVTVVPNDAIVRVTTSHIRGDGMHLRHGRVPGMLVGSVIGHKYVGGLAGAADPDVH